MVISFLVTIVCVYYNWKKGLFGRLMSITFILITYGLFTSFNAAQGFFIYLPHLARTGFLVLLTVPPLLYLSLYRGLAKKSLEQKDFFHFLPTLLYFINFVPFFILSGEEKIQLFTKGTFTSLDEGWFFPQYFVLILSVGQILFYLYLVTIKILLPSLRSKLLRKDEKSFLYTFYIYLILLLIPPSITFWTGFTGNDPRSPLLLIYISSQMIFFVVVIFQPGLIFFPFMESVGKSDSSTTQESEYLPKGNSLEAASGLDQETIQVIQLINVYFEKEKPFLKFDFNQKELAERLRLSNYLIRNSLKKSYGISFSDFVNTHRINYLKEKLSTDSKYRKYTMATLAQSIGFKSTNSLYLAFKKDMNTTPKEYIDSIND